MHSILSNPLVSGGMFLGGITAILVSLKQIPVFLFKKLRSHFIFSVVIYDYDELFYVLEEWVTSNYPQKYKNLEASFQKERNLTTPTSFDGVKKEKTIHYKQEPNVFVIKYEGKKLLFSKRKKELEHAIDLRSALNFHYTISSWKGKIAIQNFLKNLALEYNQSLLDDKVTIYVPYYDNWGVSSRRKVKTLTSVILKDGVKDLLIKDMDSFKNSYDWYTKTGIPYKRTYCFYGPGGTGKTTLAQAMAKYSKKDLCVLNLNSIPNDNILVSLFSRIPGDCLLLIEDIDCSFNQRESNKDTKVTFSCLLNCLDGVMSTEGIVTVITTNHLEKLDPALVRPGRVDIKLEMPLAENKEVEEYLSIFYNDNFYIDEPIKLSMSSVQEACIQNRNNSNRAIKKILESNKVLS